MDGERRLKDDFTILSSSLCLYFRARILRRFFEYLRGIEDTMTFLVHRNNDAVITDRKLQSRALEAAIIVILIVTVEL